MIRQNITWIFPAAFTLVGIGSSVQSTAAQTKYEFNTFYNTEVILNPITSSVSKASVSGNNPNAPYGLVDLTSLNYSQFDPTTGVFAFVPDAATFGLKRLPIGMDVYAGSGDDKLFGSSNATATIDSEINRLLGSGTVTITGGAGRFSGASGVLNFSESEPLAQDPTAPLRGQAFLSGSFQVPQNVPEPRSNTTLVGMGLIGAVSLLRRRFST